MFQSFERFTNFEKKTDLLKRSYRLDRMEFLLKSFDNPHLKFKTIHVAGSKGKGSTSTYLASILEALGFKTGLYTSPHLMDYRERVTLAGRFFEPKVYQQVVTDVDLFVEKAHSLGQFEPWGGDPTTFELLTLSAFLIFARENVEWAVIEVGMGGRLDATNLVRPQACVITPIELEHREVLGDTVELIAAEKSGILKPGVPFLTFPQKPSVEKVIEEWAEKRDCFPLFNSDLWFSAQEIQVTPEGTLVKVLKDRDHKHLDLYFSLKNRGRVMGQNALMALALLDQLFLISDQDWNPIFRALEKVALPGRMEKLETNPPVYLDGAHTPASVAQAWETFKTIHTPPFTLIFGAAEGKNIGEMAQILKPHFQRVIIARPGTFKISNLEDLAQAFGGPSDQVSVVPEALEALNTALGWGEPTLVTGSFYLAAEIKGAHEKVGKTVNP